MAKKHSHSGDGSEHEVEAVVPQEEAPPMLSVNFPSKGLSFTLPIRYSAGHQLTEQEANALNGLLCENLRNNFAKTVEDAEEAAEKEGVEVDGAALQEKFAEYAGNYTFQGKRAPRTPVDPTAREAEKIASAKIDEFLRKQGKTRKSLPEGNFDKLVGQLIERSPAIMEEARRRVALQKEIATDTLSTLMGEEGEESAAA